MHGRHWAGLVLSVLTMPLLMLGLIDPLEGGIALLAAGAMLAVTRLVGAVPLPRLTWVAWVTAAALGAIALVGAMIRWEQERGVGPEGLPWWIVVPLIGYEIAVVLSITRQAIGMQQDLDGSFDHPKLAADDPLRRHVLYRIDRAHWQDTLHG